MVSKGLSGHFVIPAESWFPVITEKIDTMKQVDDVLAKEIQATAGRLAHDARLTLILSLVLACGKIATAAEEVAAQSGTVATPAGR